MRNGVGPESDVLGEVGVNLGAALGECLVANSEVLTRIICEVISG